MLRNQRASGSEPGSTSGEGCLCHHARSIKYFTFQDFAGNEPRSRQVWTLILHLRRACSVHQADRQMDAVPTPSRHGSKTRNSKAHNISRSESGWLVET